MATRVLDGFRLFKDNGDVASDGTVAFVLAGTSTPYAPYTDRGLTTSAGSSVALASNGWCPELWVADSVSVSVTFAGTGVTTRTIPYITQASSTTTDVTSSELGLRNALSNGAFSQWGNGTSFSNVSGSGAAAETANGWYLSQNNTAANAVSRQAGLAARARYGLRVGRPNASASTDVIRLFATLPADEVFRLRGQSVTVSFTATAGANFSASGSTVTVIAATGTSAGEAGNSINSGGWAGQSNIINTAQAITGTTTRYEFTGTVPSNAQSFGLQLKYTPSGTAGSADYYQIDDVQIEIGAEATAYAHLAEPLDFLRTRLSDVGRGIFGLTDPNADRIVFWDDSAGTATYLRAHTGLSISGTDLALEAAGLLSTLLTVDGAGSGLDADKLDGEEGSFYRNATNINAGTISSSYLPATVAYTTGFTASGPIRIQGAPTNLDDAGYRGLPVDTHDADYTLVLGDSGRSMYHSSGSTHTWTIPPNASVAFPIGAVVDFVNLGAGTVTVSPGSGVTFVREASGASGSRSLPQYRAASAHKIETNMWLMRGTWA